MNKKLLTLAVAAAVAAPSAAMAEAVLYGKLNQSIDYVDITNAEAKTAATVDTVLFTGQGSNTITGTQIWPDPGLTMPFGTLPNQGSFVNATDSSVYVPVLNSDGSLNRIDEIEPGELYEGVTFSNSVETLDTESIELIEVDSAGNVIINADSGKDFNGWGISSNSWRRYTTTNALTGIETTAQGRANRLGVKGSEDLGNGLKAIYQVEFGVNFSSADNNIPSGQNGGVSMRNSFVGLAGDWGTGLVGRHDTPLKISTGKLDLFSDTMADYNGTVGFHDVRADNVIAYISPSFSGFSFMGATVGSGGATAGEGLNINSDSLAGAYSLALIYNNGPFYGSAAYEVLTNEMFMDSDVSNSQKGCVDANGNQLLNCDYVGDDFSKWRLGLGILDWNGFTLTGIYESQDDLPGGQQYRTVGYVDPNGNVNLQQQGGIKNQSLWQIQAGYSFGNNMIKAMYGAVDRDSSKVLASTRDTISLNNIRQDLGGDRSTWAVGFDHNFSKRTKLYALYTDVTDDLSDDPTIVGAEWSGFSLGMIHKF